MIKKEEALFLVFMIDDMRFALPAGLVERIVAAVEITTIPDAPSFLCGVINFAGDIVPVISLRVRFGLPAREIRISDRFIFVKHPVSNSEGDDSLFAFSTDGVEGVFELDAGIIKVPGASLSLAECGMLGIERGDDRIICIQTAETLFTATDAEIRMIEEICASAEGGIQ